MSMLRLCVKTTGVMPDIVLWRVINRIQQRVNERMKNKREGAREGEQERETERLTSVEIHTQKGLSANLPAHSAFKHHTGLIMIALLKGMLPGGLAMHVVHCSRKWIVTNLPVIKPNNSYKPRESTAGVERSIADVSCCRMWSLSYGGLEWGTD